MNFMYQSGLSLTIALTLSACGGGGSSTSTTDPNTPPNNASKPALQPASDSSSLESFIKQQMLDIYGKVRPNIYPVIDMADSAPTTSSAATGRSSSTNLQESGVDEADRIKQHNGYLYVAANNKPALRIFGTQQADTRLVKDISLGNNTEQLQGLYHTGQQLIALSGKQLGYGIWDRWFEPSGWLNQQNHVLMMDTFNPENPVQTHKLSLDGQLISSRRIDSTLYLTTRHTPSLKGLVEYPSNETEAANNRNLINQASLSDFLPNYQLDGADSNEIFSTEDCFLPPYTQQDQYQASIISVVAVDLNSAAPTPRGNCFVGDTEALYVSNNALYLATSKINYGPVAVTAATADGNDQPIRYEDPEITTELHKFSLQGGGIEYRASGRVDGHLGWYQDLKSFRLSEYNEVLRVITYTGQQTDSKASPASLYTLQENTATQTLDIMAKLPNETRPAALGKPGEQVYATRFNGEKAYLVTFQLTDPLYIVDLSNPADPFLAGELEISGYSDYLHPIGDNYLLGIGKEAVVEEGDSKGDGRGAWEQGVKLSLIDVTDPANAYEKEKIVIGKRGTQTPVSTSHHALTTFQKGATLQVALPISLHEREANFYQPGHPANYYDWNQDSLYRLNIDPQTGSWQVLPEIVGSSTDDNNQAYSFNWINDRSVMIEDYVYYLHGDEVISQAW